ncbi:MAG TPA: glycine cleavage T C-terminal barrel domain-containing protein [Baekduia sp.]|uniref:CAF17-like 4Fe-4S cluster assembly/insertion protein YgfZ n=1 Tax=Baekduia sp. TaxID=2600305 RepID=UPI002D78BC66|nr:glycine cleavage T C-terminal barrel domain-containing protein [Baekduia sp.]HET6505805.1 glycine cleavage T C-terminal barrel domain-containing protein [Baekduia sp.]
MATVDALRAGYDACVAGAALVDRSEAGKLLLTGPQAREFLDGQVSNDIAKLDAGHGRYATLLTNKGRMLADLRALALQDDALLLVTERPALQALFDQIRRGLIGWQAQLHKRTLQLALFSLIGPKAEDVARAAGLPIPGAEEHDVVAYDGDGAVVRTDLGLDVLPTAEHADATRDALLAAGAVATSEDAAEIVRVESGRPRFGRDADESAMPEEAGIVDRAVSFQKGCYVGQETVARLHWKGKPNRHLRGLRADAPLTPGTPVLLGDREIGRVGTAVVSPRLGPIALAILRREAEPGGTVRAGDADVRVVALPFA